MANDISQQPNRNAGQQPPAHPNSRSVALGVSQGVISEGAPGSQSNTSAPGSPHPTSQPPPQTAASGAALDPPAQQHPNALNGNVTLNTNINPSHDDQNPAIQHPRVYSEAEVQLLHQQIAVLQANQVLPSSQVPTDSQALQRIRQQARTLADEKKYDIPEPVQGFKANPIRNAVSTRIDEAIKKNSYIPVTTIISLANNPTAREEEDGLVLTKDGVFKVKAFDRKGELQVPFPSWLNAMNTVVNRTRELLPSSIRADRLASHITNVAYLAQKLGLEHAYRYDIEQRQTASEVPEHDVGTYNSDILSIASATSFSSSLQSIRAVSANPGRYTSMTSPSKRGFPDSDDSQGSPSKKSSAPCFRCGEPGHVSSACTASVTRTGIDCAAKEDGLLFDSNGRQYCLRWTKGWPCQYKDECYHVHECCICGERDHGAGNCTA